MAGGYSTQTFMGGLVDGYRLGQDIVDTKRRRKFEDEEHQRLKQERERKQRMDSLQTKIRTYGETGKRPEGMEDDLKFFNMHRSFDPEFVENQKDGAAGLHAVMQKLQQGQGLQDQDNQLLLKSVNKLFEHRFDERKEQDGKARYISGLRETPDGRLSFELTVMDGEGKFYKAPLTKRGKSLKDKGGEDDTLVTLTPEKMKEFYQASLGKAEMLHRLNKAKGDPAAEADAMHYALTGQRLYQPKEAEQLDYDIVQVWDEKTGRKRKAAVDRTGNIVRYVGGAEALDPSKGAGSGGSSGGGGRRSLDSIMAQWNKDRQEIMTKIYDTPEERDRALQQRNQSYAGVLGFDPEIVPILRQQMAQQGIYGDPTIEDTRRFAHLMMLAQQEQQQANQPGLELAQSQPQASTSPPPDYSDNPVAAQFAQETQAIEAQIQELEAKSMDPNYPDNARQDFDEQAQQLRGELEQRRGPSLADAKPDGPMSRRQEMDQVQAEMAQLQAELNAAQTQKERTAVINRMVALQTGANSNALGLQLATGG